MHETGESRAPPVMTLSPELPAYPSAALATAAPAAKRFWIAAPYPHAPLFNQG